MSDLYAIQQALSSCSGRKRHALANGRPTDSIDAEMAALRIRKAVIENIDHLTPEHAATLAAFITEVAA